MKTGEVADQAGVNIQTLRYYERRGLLPEPSRLDSGYREYGPEAVRTVRFIKRSQELGFSLGEVETLLQLADGGPESCEAVQELAHQKISELDGKLTSLGDMRDSLRRLAATCTRPRAERECPLLRSIEEGTTGAGRAASRKAWTRRFAGGYGIPVIGRDLGAFGLIVRLVAGGLVLAGFAGEVVTGGLDLRTGAQMLGGFAAVLVFYTALLRLLGDRLLVRVSPWIATTIVLAPLGLNQLPIVPHGVRAGIALYVGLSLVVLAAMRYGACEVVAVPSLVLGRRYVVYCPWNAVDVVERPLRFGAGREVRWVAGGMTAVVGFYFLFGSDLLQRFGVQVAINPEWAWTLLAPAALLAVNAAVAFRQAKRLSTEVRVDGLGAVVMVALTAVWSGHVEGRLIWALVMVGGLLFGLFTLARARWVRPPWKAVREAG
jgi:DNA-binding transcriptional MerR regulator